MGNKHSSTPSCGCQAEVAGEVCLNGSWFQQCTYFNGGGQPVYFNIAYNFGYAVVSGCPIPLPSSDSIVTMIANWYSSHLAEVALGAVGQTPGPGKIYYLSTANNCQISYSDLLSVCDPKNNSQWSQSCNQSPFQTPVGCTKNSFTFPSSCLPSNWAIDNL